MDNKSTLKFVFGASLTFGAIAGYFGGTWWAIIIGALFFITGISIINDQKKDQKNKSSNKPKNTTSPTPHTKAKTQTKTRPIIDVIKFEYRTKEGIKDFYTVDVHKGINGNIEGWCHERDANREFRKDRIIGNSIIRIETGEVMSVKEWRKLALTLNKQVV